MMQNKSRTEAELIQSSACKDQPSAPPSAAEVSVVLPGWENAFDRIESLRPVAPRLSQYKRPKSALNEGLILDALLDVSAGYCKSERNKHSVTDHKDGRIVIIVPYQDIITQLCANGTITKLADGEDKVHFYQDWKNRIRLDVRRMTPHLARETKELVIQRPNGRCRLIIRNKPKLDTGEEGKEDLELFQGESAWLMKYVDQAKDARRFQDTRYYVDGKIEPWHPAAGKETDPEMVHVSDEFQTSSSRHKQFERISDILKVGPGITVLLGDPGTGKTTSLRRHLHMKAIDIMPEKPSGLIPIYVDLTNSSGDPERMTCAAIKEATGIEPPSSEWSCREFTIMFDGVDRMRLDCDFQYFFRRIRDHQVWAPHSRVILTCKVGEWNPAYLRGDDVATYKLCPFGVENREEIAEYVERRLHWPRRVPKEIAKDWRLLDMARNPQLLAMMCDLLDPHLPDAGLPQQKAQLIERWIKRTLELQGIGKDWFAEAGEAFLSAAAYVMMDRGILEISKSDLKEAECLVPHYYVGDRNVVELAVNAGLLASSGHTAKTGHIRFVHQTFQEYFAARAISTQSGDWLNVAMSRVYDARWQEVLILLGELLRERTRVYVLALLRETRQDILLRPLRIAVMIARNANTDVLSLTIVDQLRRTTVEFELREEISIQFNDLAILWGESALPYLFSLLRKRDKGLQRRIVGLFGCIGSEKALRHLVPSLSSKDFSTLVVAVEALGGIGGQKAVDQLLPFLKENRGGGLPWLAARSLGMIGGEMTVNRLISLLSDRWSVHAAVVQALGVIGDEKAVDHLAPFLDVKHSCLRAGVVEALGMIGGKLALQHLVRLLSDEDIEIRFDAVEAIGMVGGQVAINHLLPLLEDNDDDMLASAAEALGLIGDESTVDHLLPLLDNNNLETCVGAVEALGRIGGEKALHHLLPLLKRKDAKVRRTVVQALGGIGGQKAVDHLLPFLNKQNQDGELQSIAARSLGMIGGEMTVTRLLPLLNDKRAARAAVALALGMIGDERAVNHLVPFLNDKDFELRSEARDALGRIGGEKALHHLLPLLKGQQAETIKDMAMLRNIAGRHNLSLPLTELPEPLMTGYNRLVAELEKIASLCES